MINTMISLMHVQHHLDTLMRHALSSNPTCTLLLEAASLRANRNRPTPLPERHVPSMPLAYTRGLSRTKAVFSAPAPQPYTPASSCGIASRTMLTESHFGITSDLILWPLGISLHPWVSLGFNFHRELRSR